MATRGSIPKMMELAGIDMLPPEAGIPLIRRELTAGGTSGEIVIAERLGVLLNEWDATGGLDPSAPEAWKNSAAQGPMIGNAASMSVQRGLTIECTLDPAVQPFLHDHQIDGTPVLPGVMGIEAFAEAALCPASRLACGSDRRCELPRAVQVLSQRTAHSDGRSSYLSAARHLAGRLPLDGSPVTS